MYKFEDNSLEVGPASFTILAVYDTNADGSPMLSKASGKPMIKFKLSVTDNNGNSGLLYDYLPLMKKMDWKAKAIAHAVGMPQLYSSAGLDAKKLVNGKGRCLLKMSESPGYEPKIAIDEYIAHSGSALEEPPTAQDFNDEIPF